MCIRTWVAETVLPASAVTTAQPQPEAHSPAVTAPLRDREMIQAGPSALAVPITAAYQLGPRCRIRLGPAGGGGGGAAMCPP